MTQDTSPAPIRHSVANADVSTPDSSDEGPMVPRLPFGHRTAAVRSYSGVMTDSDCPWEAPLAGTEAEHLVGALDRLRTTFRWKANDLDAAAQRARIAASSLPA
jgi:hypothetical protein